MATSDDNNTVTKMVSSASESESESVVYPVRPYDVFLSFRGPDTRYGFSDYLYHALHDADIKTFRDIEELRLGDELGPEIVKAIEESTIAIPVLSKGYAKSKWCLREFAKIAECRKKMSQMVIPIFYHVNPSKVKDFKNWCYKDSFITHEKMNVPEQDLKVWREAFEMFGENNKPKWLTLNKGAEPYQAAVVKEVVEIISRKLNIEKAYVPDILVGMKSHIQKLEVLLNSIVSDHERVITIVGMSGIGKTTIAGDFYNKLKYDFGSHHCFLEDVGGNSQDDVGLKRLQQQLVSKIRNRGKPDIDDIHKGSNMIKGVIGVEKVLIVLDNVNSKSQIEMLLAGGMDSLQSNCKPGSLFIITTTDENIVPESKVTRRYKPELMEPRDALRLFCQHAFKKNYPLINFDSLTKKFVSSAEGLPLALVILGSLLYDKDTTLWEATLKKLKEVPRTEVLERLRIGYDALDYAQKQIFLDIACFFVGEHKEYPLYMWEDCGFHPLVEGIEALHSRSLITFRKGDNMIIRMHDQLIQLGRQIVKEKAAEPYLKVPRKRSRLWDRHEALETLTNHQGAEKVEALNLNLTAVKKEEHEQLVLLGGDYVHTKFVTQNAYIRRLGEKDFSHLPNLRFLRLGSVFLYGDFKGLFSNLRWLEWRCRQTIIPFNFYPKNLVILDLSNSTITDEWEHWTSFKVAKKLKVLNLSGCQSLRRAPEFFTTLEILKLSRTRLEQITPWLSKLTALRDLDISSCHHIENLDCSALTKLVNLNLLYCQLLSEVTGLEKLVSLTNLKTAYSYSLRTLGNISSLKMLKVLEIYNCSLFTEIQGLNELESLELLNMSSCSNVERLPDLSKLKRLKKMLLSNCKKLVEIGGLSSLVSLEHLDLKKCESIVTLHVSTLGETEGSSGLVSLKILDLSNCDSLENSLDLSNLKSLEILRAYRLKHWTKIMGLEELKSLQVLNVEGCRLLEKLPDFSDYENMKELNARTCTKLAPIQGLDKLKERNCKIWVDPRHWESLSYIAFQCRIRPNSIFSAANRFVNTGLHFKLHLDVQHHKAPRSSAQRLFLRRHNISLHPSPSPAPSCSVSLLHLYPQPRTPENESKR